MTGFAVQLPRIGVFKILRIAHLHGDPGQVSGAGLGIATSASDSAIAPSADISSMAHFSLFGPAAAASSRCVRESSTPATRPPRPPAGSGPTSPIGSS